MSNYKACSELSPTEYWYPTIAVSHGMPAGAVGAYIGICIDTVFVQIFQVDSQRTT